jgi:hypothetical protein
MSNGAGKRPSKVAPELVAEIRRLHDNGLSAGAIGKLVGRSKSAVIGIQHRNGMQVQHPGWHPKPMEPKEKARILELRRLGWSYKEIGRSVGRGQDRVGRVCLAAGFGKGGVTCGNGSVQSFQMDRKVVRSAKQVRAKEEMLLRMGAVSQALEPLPPPDTSLEPLVAPAPRPCQYIADDGAPWRICGRPVTRRSDGLPGSWCAHHYRVCFRPVHDLRVPWLPQHATGQALAEELPSE